MVEDNEGVVRRFFEEVFGGGNLDLVDELVAPGHVNHDPNAPEVEVGPEGIKQLIGMYREAFPDICFTIEEMVVEGDSPPVDVSRDPPRRDDGRLSYR